MIRFIIELLAIVFLTSILVVNQAGPFIFVLTVVWTARAIKRFMDFRKKNEFMRVRGYEKNPVVSASKLMKQLLKDNLLNVKKIAFGSITQFKQDQSWDEAVVQYDALRPKQSYDSSLGTSNVWVNILGGYFLQNLFKKQEDAIRIIIVKMNDGKYKFAVNTGIKSKKIKKLRELAAQANIPVEGDDASMRSTGSFRLTS